MSSDRSQSIAVSFAARYYTALVETPADVPNFYSVSATIRHEGRSGRGCADVAAVLKHSVAPLRVQSVRLQQVSPTRTAKGSIVVSITGVFVGAEGERDFAQTVELREQQANTFAIIADTLRLPTAKGPSVPTMSWATETPPMFAKKAEEDIEEMVQPAAVTEVAAPAAPAPAPAAPVVAAAAAPVAEKKAEPVPEAPKAPVSFAEALKLKKANATAPSAAVVRVSDKPAEEPKKKAEPKKSAAAAGKSEPKKEEGASKRSAAKVVYYDVIVKGLPTDAKEDAVRQLISADVPVKLVKVETHASKKDVGDMRTFAFVQLDKEAMKQANQDVKETIAKIIAAGNAEKKGSIQFEEVKERKFSNNKKK